MKVGDRVIYNKNIKATVIHIDSNTVNEFIQIRFEQEINAWTLENMEPGTNLNDVTWWAEPEYLVLDAEWLREEKLKEIGI